VGAGSAVPHDDAGYVHHRGVRSAFIHDDAGNMHPN
jgi:hypothetical protein